MKGKEGAHSVLSFAPHFRLENVTCALALTATYGSFVMLESITASFPSNHASCSRARLKIPNFVIKGFTFSFQNDFLVAIASWLQWRFVSYPSRWVLAELTVQQGINKVRLLRWTFRSAFQCSGKKGKRVWAAITWPLEWEILCALDAACPNLIRDVLFFSCFCEYGKFEQFPLYAIT